MRWILPVVPKDNCADVEAAGVPKLRVGVDVVVLACDAFNANPVLLGDPNNPIAGLVCSLLSPEPVLNWNPMVGAAKKYIYKPVCIY